MEMEVLKKKISSYRTSAGKITRVSDELCMEVLRTWEEWTGTKRDFYTSIGVDFRKMASIIGRAKKLKREGNFPAEDFNELRIAGGDSSNPLSIPQITGIEIVWNNGTLIRFSQVELLLDFLKKAS